ncbi:epsin-1-like [Zingiber officinale]|uniref:epsin-1-like n=1 Tax=Zingiber officinale TaxID=94328 RepID=UPI001C4D0F2E|nr:epsin-1-like [Zingiber officinale]
MTSMQRTLDTLVDLVGSWVTVHPGPSPAPVPPTEDAPDPDSAAVPAPATTSAPTADPAPTPPGDELIEFYSGLIGGPAGVQWIDGRAFGEGPRARHRGDAQALAPAEDEAEEEFHGPASPNLEETVSTRLEELTLEVASLRTTLDTVVQQQTSMQATMTSMQRTLDTLVDLVGSWVTVHPSQSGPSPAPVPPAEDAPDPDSAAVPAPATTSAPAADPAPTPPGDELIEFYVPI